MEIREALNECGGNKAPGPDGLSMEFFKRNWDLLKEEIIPFFNEFHCNGKLHSGLNTANLVLIPKVKNPSKFGDYRPISLVGATYKILSKVLVRRFKSTLHEVIDEGQNAFLASRQILDGVLIANETIDWIKTKNIKGAIFKVDFEKAYDSVDWEFVDYMLRRMGFGNRWRKWIKECISSASLSVLINGSTTNQFPMKRGLRQGDPLSPFLFLIVVEGLKGMFREAIDKGILKGIKMGSY